MYRHLFSLVLVGLVQNKAWTGQDSGRVQDFPIFLDKLLNVAFCAWQKKQDKDIPLPTHFEPFPVHKMHFGLVKS